MIQTAEQDPRGEIPLRCMGRVLGGIAKPPEADREFGSENPAPRFEFGPAAYWGLYTSPNEQKCPEPFRSSASVQTLPNHSHSMFDANAISRTGFGYSGLAWNPAASTSYAINHFAIMPYVCKGRG